MFPDAKWIDVLSLPSRVTGGIAIGTVAILLLDHFGILPLSAFGTLTWGLMLIIAVLSSCLFLASMIDAAFKHREKVNRPKRLAERQKAAKDEREAERRKYEEQVLQRLDYLSNVEISYAADALRDNAQSFLAYIHCGYLTSMSGKGLIYTPGGEHDQDHYPFSFFDFVWAELLRRKEEFIGKDDAFTAAKKKLR